MVQYVLYKEEVNMFIAYSNSRKIIHVTSLEDAHKFNTSKQARKAREKASRKMAYYRVYIVTENGELVKESSDVSKRKKFSQEERKRIYQKTNGYCYLCGEFVGFDVFEIEHKIPLTKGGTNDFGNLFPSCHCCNSMKNCIYPEELMEKIVQIFMYQVMQKENNHSKYVIANKIIKSMQIQKVGSRFKVWMACKLLELVIT